MQYKIYTTRAHVCLCCSRAAIAGKD